MALSIRKDDKVLVIAGKARGDKPRAVLAVLPKKDRIVVEGVNVVKRHTRQRGPNRAAGIVEREAPIHISNVQLFCEKCNSAGRFGSRVTDGGDKVRVCKKCGADV
jgi:large subunit ribosomal protein L24